MNDVAPNTGEQLADENHYREPNSGKFVAGHAPLPGAGRPRKGETIAEKVAIADAKVARRAIKARNKRLELTNAVGERAWSTYLAYNLGIPAQKFIVEQSDSPLLGFLMRHTAQLPYVDGESRDITTTDSAQS